MKKPGTETTIQYLWIIVAAYIFVTVMPVSAVSAANGTVIAQGATVFMGEGGLNVTHALNSAYYGELCGGIVDSRHQNAKPPLTRIGWWASAADIFSSAPSKTVNLSTRYRNLKIEPSDFVGYTGTWYLLRANRSAYSPEVCSGNASQVFIVVDPSLNIIIWDFNKNQNVTGKSVSIGDRLGFRIDTNMYPAVDSKYRGNIIYASPQPDQQSWWNGTIQVIICLSCGTFRIVPVNRTTTYRKWMGWTTWMNSSGNSCYSEMSTRYYNDGSYMAQGDYQGNSSAVIGEYYYDPEYYLPAPSAPDNFTKNPACGGSAFLDPAADGFITIVVKNASGYKFSALYNDSTSAGPVAGPHSLLKNYVDKQLFFWGSPSTFSWKTGALDNGTNFYPKGTYTVWSESTLNHMMDNYKNGGADYTGKTVSRAYFLTLIAPPTVTFVSPTSGPTGGGRRVTVTGTGFTGAAAVRFGTTAGTGLTVNSSTKITITTPAHAAGTVDVTVITPGGTSAIVARDKFTYVRRPTVTAISPTSGSTSGNTLVTITGTGFTGATAVRFGTTKNSTPITVVSSTKITARSPAHAAGTVDITVTTPGGTSPVSTADRFTFA